MNLIKTFIITLVIYIVINLLFALIYVFTLPFSLPDAGIVIVAMMFGPIVTPPNIAWVDSGVVAIIQLISVGGDASIVLTFLYYVVPPLVAVIVGGILSDTPSIAFLSWFLTAVICIVIYGIILGVAHDYTVSLTLWTLVQTLSAAYGPTDLYIAIVIFGIINILLYGCVSFLITRNKL